MHVLVTGGAGFVGSHVVEQLLATGHRVRVLDAFIPQAWAGGDPAAPPIDGVELRRGDVRDAETCASALVDIDAVCHQAALVGLGVDVSDFPAYASCNELGTTVLLAAMARAGIGRLVLASSMVVYGEGAYRCRQHGRVRPAHRATADLDAGRFEPGCPTCGAPLDGELVGEDDQLDPRNAYATSKLAQEHYAAAWARSTGASGQALRYHNVYGPRMPRDTPYAGVAAIFRSALERGQAPPVFEDGGQRRDFVHVSDAARANVLALERGTQPGTLRAYNVGSGEPHTVGAMALALAEAAGGPDPVVTGKYRLGDVRHIVASSARAAAELGYAAAVSFADGMREFAVAPLR